MSLVASNLSIDLSIYATELDVISTYQTLANMSTTFIHDSSIYYDSTHINNTLQSYQLISDMNKYLSTASAASLYQPISSMNNYLTVTNASSTYQPITAMNSYLI